MVFRRKRKFISFQSSLRIATISAILIATVITISAFADAPGTGVVKEGVSVPGVALGDTRSQVEAAWGLPVSCQNVSGYDQGSCLFIAEEGGQIFVRYRGADGGSAQNSPTDVVHSIRWYQQVDGWFTTAGINSTIAYDDPDAVLAAYPNATINQQSLFDWSIDDPALGIHVYYHTLYLTGELVVSMGITHPTTPPPPPDEFYAQVYSIDFYTVKRNDYGARVQIREVNGGYLEGAIVTATWISPDGEQISLGASTDSFGKAYFDLGKLKRHGTYTLMIEDVVLDGYVFDPESSILSASLTK